ncbi:MAG TPA: AAA family ATPase [Ktedonobacteraceae bacterium]
MTTSRTSATARPASAASNSADATTRGEPARGLLRLAVLGSPEVFYDGSRLTFSLRKAQALLLYLAVEGGMHARSKLAAFLWPDSEHHDARTALRNAIVLLRRLLADADPSASLPSAQSAHLLIDGNLLGLDPHAPRELDLEVVQHVWKEAQLHSMTPSQERRTALVAHLQHALSLVRGPFLEGFGLHEETGFDRWVQQQRQQWQVRLQFLLDRLSSWQEEAFELEPARATLTRWLALDPLSEEAYQRLMRIHLALDDATAALQVYATCRTRLAEELQVKPSTETVALAEHIRATAAARRVNTPARPSTTTMARSRSTAELTAPMVGRAAAFSQLVGSFQQARQGQPRVVLIEGEAGIGKTRLATEFVAWAGAQGADVLSGHAFEMGGRLPYQPLVEALRGRLEAENAPEDLLEDLWLVELARLLPELRVRYPDLPAPTEDELTARVSLFEAVARLLDALAQRAPLVLLLDDLHWVDGASLDLLRYLGHYWKEHDSRVLLLGTVRQEGLEPRSQLAAQLADLGRDLPVRWVALQTLSQAETLQLIEVIVGVEEESTRSGGEQREHGLVLASTAGSEAPPSPERERPLVRLGNFLFTHTGGQPLYLLETLKLLREQQWLVPRLEADGTWRLEPTVEIAAALAQEQSRRALLPPSVRALIQVRLAKLSQPARQLVMAAAVLGTQASAQRLWQLAELGVQEGLEALEEAVGSGILHEEEAAGEPGLCRPGSYRFAHELMREAVYTELSQARRLVLHQRALAVLRSEGAPAAELVYHALATGEAKAASRYSVQAGDEAMAVFALQDGIGHYERARALLKAHQPLQAELPASEVDYLYAHLGQAYAFQSDWEQAQQVYNELVAYGQQHQWPTLVSMTLNRLAVLAAQQSFDKPKVQALLEEAWQMAEASHDQRALAETAWNLAQIIALVWDDPVNALPRGQQALSLARGIHDRELEARCLFTLGVIHTFKGDFEEAMHCVEASLALYATLGTEQTASRELSIANLLLGSPLTQPLTNHASEAVCWVLLAYAQVNSGQVHNGIRSGHRALALSKESKNGWVHVASMAILTFGLLEAGAYEEAFGLMHSSLALARALPQMVIFQLFVHALGSMYHFMQQWEEARRTLAEAEAMAEALDLRLTRVRVLSKLCMHHALAGQWEAAYRYAVKAIALRESYDVALLALDFYRHYETEALLHAGDERQAREEVQRLGDCLGPNRRFRISYLRSRALLAEWDGQPEQAIGHLHEAAQLAAEIGLPAEQWQIQAMLGSLYEAGGEQGQACTAFGEAARIIAGLAKGIGDEARRSRFLAAPQIQQVMQQTYDEMSFLTFRRSAG